MYQRYVVSTSSLSLSDLWLHKQNKPKKKFIYSLQNSSWQYWPHFQTIQPNTLAKGMNTFQPSLDTSNVATINQADPSYAVLTPLSSNAMIIDPILATPAITNRRPFNSISLNSDNETGTEGDHFVLSPMLIRSSGHTGSKTTVFSSSAKKVSQTYRSSTPHSSSPISGVFHSLKPSSLISKLPTSQSKKLLTAGLLKNVKLNMIKDLSHALVVVKDSLLVSP